MRRRRGAGRPGRRDRPPGPAAIVEATLARFGRIDGLVNNAGIARFAPIEEAERTDLDAMAAVHILAPFLL